MKQKIKAILIRAALFCSGGLITGLILIAIFSIRGDILSGSAHLFAQSPTQSGRPDVGIVPQPSIVDLQSSFREIIKHILPSIVTINVEHDISLDELEDDEAPWFDFFFRSPDDEEELRNIPPAQGLGSGIVFRRTRNTYYVVTNMHVVGDADKLTVILENSDEYEATMVGGDLRKDIAVISFTSTQNIPTATLGDSDTTQVGDWVLAIGSPFNLQSTVTAGIVSALGRHGGPAENISDFIQTDAAINQGNSGGALVNLYGEVIGINTWIASMNGLSMGFGFAIPINNVRNVVNDLIAFGKVKYGWLGVSIRTIDDDNARDLGLSNNDGALVPNVYLNSPAAKAGILPGDFIVRINDKDLTTAEDVVLFVGDLPVGEEAQFVVIRQGKRKTVPVTIAARQDEESIANQNHLLWPGIGVTLITDEYRALSDIPETIQGMRVDRIEPQSPASEYLKHDDIVISIEGEETDSLSVYYELLNNIESDILQLVVYRDEETTDISIKFEK